MKKLLIIISGAMFLTVGSVMAQQMPSSSSDTTGTSQTPTGVKRGDNSDLYRKDQSGTRKQQGDHKYNSSTRQTDSVRNQSGINRRRRSDGSMTPGSQYRSPVDSASKSGTNDNRTMPNGSSSNGSSSNGSSSGSLSTGSDANGTSGTGTQPRPAGGQ